MPEEPHGTLQEETQNESLGGVHEDVAEASVVELDTPRCLVAATA